MLRTLFLCLFLPTATDLSSAAQVPSQAAPRATMTLLTGVVADPTGAVVPGATLTLHGQGPDVSATSGPAGDYKLSAPANFSGTLTVSAQGFAPFVNPRLTLNGERARTLNIQLIIAGQTEQIEVSGADSDATDPNNNGDAIKLGQKEIDLLPTNQTELSQQLAALSGGTSPDIYVDGFSGGTLPPKDTIREIRINQNPYSAQNDTNPVNGQIQIFTKPGTDKLHGFFFIFANDSAFNSQNPFAPNTPAYYSYFTNGNISGPIDKHSSFFFGLQRRSSQSNTIVAAQDINLTTLLPENVSQALPAPTTGTTFTARYDLALGKKSTAIVRYVLDTSTSTNGGVGQLTLASQGYNNSTTAQTLQISNSQIVTAKIVNDTRFQYIRSRIHQTPYSTAPSIVVEGAFNGGGSNGGSFRDNSDRYELQNYVSASAGKQFLTFGGRFRYARDANSSTANYNGQYIFATLAAYQATLQGVQSASQFTVTTGTPGAVAAIADGALFFQDDWKLRPDLTFSPGLRWESQSGIPDHSDWAPRVGIAWGLLAKKGKPAPYTLRGGAGIFYQRFGYSYLLQTVRQNGFSQQQYVVQAPTSYPAVPAPSTLVAQGPPSRYQISPNFHTAYFLAEQVSLERRFGTHGSATATYTNTRGIHDLVTANVNAPLPGTYNAAVPTSGVRPLGTTQNVYQYSSVGLDRSNRLAVFMNLHFKDTYLWGFYQLKYSKTEGNPGSLLSNSYNAAQDYGRAPNDVRNQFYMGMSSPVAFGIRTYVNINAQAGAPFDITVGQDLNGDSQFNDRPAFATDLTRPSVVHTRYGAFDTAPIAGQTVIPRNYGQGPATVFIYTGVSREFAFGPVRKPPAGFVPPRLKPGEKPPKPDRAYNLELSADASNLLNHTNLNTPVGTLNSPLFGHSTALANGNNSGNRQVELQLGFRF